MNEPRTEAGRRVWREIRDSIENGGGLHLSESDIAEIEAEAAASPAPDRGLLETIQPIVNDWFDNGYEAGRLDTVALAERITAALEAEGSREGR